MFQKHPKDQVLGSQASSGIWMDPMDEADGRKTNLDDTASAQFNDGCGDEHSKSPRPSLFTVGIRSQECILDEGTLTEEEAIAMQILETGVPPPPDGGWGWVVVFASFVCNLILDGITCTFGVFLPQMAETFNAGKGQVAWAGSILCGGSLCVGPIVGALVNKFGCRIVCISGSLIASLGFVISAFSPNLSVLLLSYGVLGGIGFGLIYLPTVVIVGYYFEKKRARATGIAVCGSGFGATSFAPMASWLTTVKTWQDVNLIYAGLLFLCSLCGLLMRPLEVKREALDDDFVEPLDEDPKKRPLLHRMAEEKKHYLHEGSIAGSEYFKVQLPDGTFEIRSKLPLNIDPGVHSNFHIDQTSSFTPVPVTPIHSVLPTITEADASKLRDSDSERSSTAGSGDLKMSLNEASNPFDFNAPPVPNLTEFVAPLIPEAIAEEPEDDACLIEALEHRGIPIKGPIRSIYNDEVGVNSKPSSFRDSHTESYSFKDAQEYLGTSGSPTKSGRFRKLSFDEGDEYAFRNGLPHAYGPRSRNESFVSRDSSVLNEDGGRERRYSITAVPATTKIPTLFSSRGSAAQLRSVSSFVGSRKGSLALGSEEFYYGSLLSKGELSGGGFLKYLHKDSSANESLGPRIIRPLSRKDIFYSGSIQKLPEFQSQKSIHSYHQSILNLPKESTTAKVPLLPTKPSICPSWFMEKAGAFKLALTELMDFSLLRNPIFLFIALSGVVGMLGFYVPFVYIVDYCQERNIDKDRAALLISIIGIMNTVGRVGFGALSDLPQVNSLYLNNVCILFMGLTVAMVPLCTDYVQLIVAYISFGLFLSGYVSLTSIILVDLLGLEKLTNSFGLLIFFRGAASIVGAPLAGAMYDIFKSYQIPFFVAGSFLTVSALIASVIPFIAKYAPPKVPLVPKTGIMLGHHQLEGIPEGHEPSSQSHSHSEVSEIKEDHLALTPAEEDDVSLELKEIVGSASGIPSPIGAAEDKNIPSVHFK